MRRMDEDQLLHSPGDAAGNPMCSVEPFQLLLANRELELMRGPTETLQVNVGLVCNQKCEHCHLDAGPGRHELMDHVTCNEVIDFAQRCQFQCIDITGGAPEMNPNLPYLIERLATLAPRIMLRSNLTALFNGNRDHLMELYQRCRVVLVASFPSLNKQQFESQRGEGMFDKSITALKQLNAIGYGQPGSGLELNLVSNPVGAFLPPSEGQAEKKLRQDLQKRSGAVFNKLYVFANAPLGRFRQWLVRSGNLEAYMQKLAARFNPCTLQGLMCRSLISIGWDGYLYDCDFNQAKKLFLGGRKRHVSAMNGPPEPGSPIAVADHCYACTAGSGFT
jgi:radical SAM/Cys-rich protein